MRARGAYRSVADKVCVLAFPAIFLPSTPLVQGSSTRTGFLSVPISCRLHAFGIPHMLRFRGSFTFGRFLAFFLLPSYVGVRAPCFVSGIAPAVYGFRDEARARTGRTRCHTLIMVYQFANAPLSKEIIVEKLNDAMLPTDDVGDALEPPEYEILGLQPESSEMLDMVHEDGYFPHFSQVRGSCVLARLSAPTRLL